MDKIMESLWVDVLAMYDENDKSNEFIIVSRHKKLK